VKQKQINMKDITKFADSILEMIGEKNIELYKKVIGTSRIGEVKNARDFFYKFSCSWSKFIDGYVRSEVSKNSDVQFIYKNYHFIEVNFKYLFKKVNGNAYCADRARTMVSSLVIFFETGKKIEFDYSQEYIYQLPETIFKDHDHIVTYYEALKDLRYGRYEKYLEALKLVLSVK